LKMDVKKSSLRRTRSRSSHIQARATRTRNSFLPARVVNEVSRTDDYFFSSRGLRQMFAKYYFNNPTYVTLP